MSEAFLAPDTYDAAKILGLIKLAFQEQCGRIDPPSSMTRLAVGDIKDHLANQMAFVIERGDMPVACLFGTQKPTALYISKLSVHPDARGMGYAKTLINAAEARAQNLGLPHLELISRRELSENHAMFRHLGFEKFAEGSHPGYDVVTEFHFRKALR